MASTPSESESVHRSALAAPPSDSNSDPTPSSSASTSSSVPPVSDPSVAGPAAAAAAAATAAAPYEPPQPSGSLLLAWQTRTLSVLLIGGGTVAASRLYHLLCAQPRRITVLAPREGTCDEVAWRIESTHPEAVAGRKGVGELEWRDRALTSEALEREIDGFGMVLTALDDPELSRAVYTACKKRGILVNVADVPPECDFYFGSTLRRGALSVMVSTNGKGPRLAARLRRRVEKALPDGVGPAIENVGQLRAGLRRRENGKDTETIARRMEWMIRVSDRWSVAQLGEMDERMRDAVLDGWDKGEARGYWDVNRTRYGGVGVLLSWCARVTGGGICPVDRDPDGSALKCPFLVGSAGFLLGVASTATVLAAAGWMRQQR